MAERGRLGGQRAAQHPDRAEILARARAAYRAQLEEQVDPAGILSPAERRKRANYLGMSIARRARREAEAAEGGAA